MIARSLKYTLLFLFLLLSFAACIFKDGEVAIFDDHPDFVTFKDDLDFLRQHTEVVLLRESGPNGMLILSPQLQGRVLTSSSQGITGRSYGWINKTLFSSGDTLEHINPYGGEERLWLGPEGGQFSIFFPPESSFTLENWQTPRLIDLEPFTVVDQSRNRVVFTKTGRVKNYSGFTFEVDINRTVDLLSRADALSKLGIPDSEEISVVGYSSTNELTNAGSTAWDKSTGLLSIWNLGMFPATDETTVIIPYISGEEDYKGITVNDKYFGEVPANRLRVADDIIFFKGDGKYRSKIGLNSERALFIFGAYDALNQVLSIVKFDKPMGVKEYVNSLWEIQEEPYRGDVVNSYNDGPVNKEGQQLGAFYELETSSPALALQPGQSGVHIQSTFHLEGDRSVLNEISKNLLSVSLDEVESAFDK